MFNEFIKINIKLFTFIDINSFLITNFFQLFVLIHLYQRLLRIYI